MMTALAGGSKTGPLSLDAAILTGTFGAAILPTTERAWHSAVGRLALEAALASGFQPPDN